MLTKLTDLVPLTAEPFKWNSTSAVESLDRYQQSLDQEADRTIKWYYARRRAPAIAARVVRWLAILATVIGGLYPVWIRLAQKIWATPPELGYPLLALAAALIAFDRFGGVSSAWMRYIVTAQAITHEQRVFRLDWNQMRANIEAAAQPPSYSQLIPLFERLRSFAAKHDDLIESETRTWMAEFRSVLSELGRAPKKDEPLPGALPAGPSPAVQMGSIDLTIDGPDVADGDVVVDVSGVKRNPMRGTNLHIDQVPVGKQKIAVFGKVNGFDATWEADVMVSAGNIVTASAKRM